SVEFDVRTLSPTYKLVIGLPGRSQALAIGRRLGLAESIVEAARKHISTGAARVEDLLGQIQAERRQIGRLFRRTRELHDDARKLRNRVQAELVRTGEERERVLAESRDEAAAAVRELRQRLREIEETARGSASRSDQRELRERIQEAQSEAAAVLDIPETREPVTTVQPVRAGATVLVQSLGQQGSVIAVEGDEAEVQVGNFKLRRPLDDLQPLRRSERKAERAVQYIPATEAPALELDVRGQRADDVLREIDQYLHDNYVHGQSAVRIVHGKGTGALRRAIRDQLRDHPLVKGYGPEKPERGGEGVTVVQLTT
ncbi:MAG TPA: Smr/MutS family protein, partial [Chloroflexota bacterium]|nr:Smr/MutS family protein [Chloroflexota bacterium]